MIVPGNGATGGEKVGGGNVRGTPACLRAAPMLCCPVALHAARLPCCPAALLPCCPAATHAGMLPCSQADMLMRRVINPDNGAAVLPRRPSTAVFFFFPQPRLYPFSVGCVVEWLTPYGGAMGWSLLKTIGALRQPWRDSRRRWKRARMCHAGVTQPRLHSPR